MPRAFTEEEQSQLRDALLQAARKAIARTGFRKTNVADLTRAVGISKGAFYRFFDSKEALWSTVLFEAEATARRDLRTIVDDGEPEPLRRVLTQLFRNVWSNPLLAALTDPEDLTWLVRSLPAGTLEAARADDDRFFTALWRDLQKQGAVDPRLDATVLAGIPGVALAMAQSQTNDTVVDLVVDALAERLRADRGARAPTG